MKFYFLLVVLLSSSIYFNQKSEKPIIQVDRQFHNRNFDNFFLKTISMGNKRLISSSLWVITLLESDLDHYKAQDLNSWMYLRFRSIIDLDSKFLEAYLYGGIYLSVVKDDEVGAKDIFERGLVVYPNHYHLIWYTAFHSYFELGDIPRAYTLYSKILNYPQAPPYLASIVSKLKVSQGDYVTARNLLIETYNKIPTSNEVLRKKYAESIISLNVQEDLECLNAKKKCTLNSPQGYTYVVKNGKYISEPPHKPFKLFRGVDKN